MRSEQWPYQMARLVTQPSPASRWPQLAVDPACRHPIRSGIGQSLFVTQCLSCHKLNGAGSGDMGPDLNQPMSPTRYLSPGRASCLDPRSASVRDWPVRKMQGFCAAAAERPGNRSDRQLSSLHGREEPVSGHNASPRAIVTPFTYQGHASDREPSSQRPKRGGAQLPATPQPLLHESPALRCSSQSRVRAALASSVPKQRLLRARFGEHQIGDAREVPGHLRFSIPQQTPQRPLGKGQSPSGAAAMGGSPSSPFCVSDSETDSRSDSRH